LPLGCSGASKGGCRLSSVLGLFIRVGNSRVTATKSSKIKKIIIKQKINLEAENNLKVRGLNKANSILQKQDSICYSTCLMSRINLNLIEFIINNMQVYIFKLIYLKYIL
jgi:hypothetical protein